MLSSGPDLGQGAGWSRPGLPSLYLRVERRAAGSTCPGFLFADVFARRGKYLDLALEDSPQHDRYGDAEEQQPE
jgi:hypothetical protein